MGGKRTGAKGPAATTAVAVVNDEVRGKIETKQHVGSYRMLACVCACACCVCVQTSKACGVEQKRLWCSLVLALFLWRLDTEMQA